ncbi:MAG: flagellar basal body L-ring protein FlgH [Pseudomonadota bacterium]|nr:flagellar basal body L-ring protein FlgH [Pseudomonadota bacterium]
MTRRAALPVLLLLAPAWVSADSLWTTGGGERLSMFADHKGSRVGDIVTVVVQEQAAAQSTQNKQSTRTSTVNDAVGQFVFPNGLMHSGALPSLQLAGKSDYTGGGQVSNSQTVSSRAAVLVTDVLPNGNFVIEGVRLVTFSGETQYIVLHGIIRPDDVASDNTVNSTNIAEARVEVVSQGALTDAQKLGWFAKLYEKLRPF